MAQNSILPTGEDVAARIAHQSLERRGLEYTDEVRRLLDAALEVMRRSGTSSRARVVDIVTAAGLSNDAFYRHFRSKDALVAAVLEDGTERLKSYLAHHLAKERTPTAKIRSWIEGVLSQTDPEVAEATLAVLFNDGGHDGGAFSGPYPASGPLAALLVEPLESAGSTRPELDASFVAHAVIGQLADHLRQRTRPTADDVDHVVDVSLRAVGARRGTPGMGRGALTDVRRTPTNRP